MESKSVFQKRNRDLAKKLFPNDPLKRIELRMELLELRKGRFGSENFQGYHPFAVKFSNWIKKDILGENSRELVERRIYGINLKGSSPKKGEDLWEHALENQEDYAHSEMENWGNLVRLYIHNKTHRKKKRVKIPTSESLEYLGNPSVKPLKSNAYYAYL